jgi:polyhydroxybutyrate depolymerase
MSRILLLVVLALLLFLCLIATATYWAIGPSFRCARPTEGAIEPGWAVRTLVSGDTERCYYLYAPPGYNPAQPLPLVLSFHSFLTNPGSHALITSWHQLADSEGFLVAFPQGTDFPQRWNAGATWGASDVNDVQFYRDMLDDISGAAAVDHSRVYVDGLSNGGGMAVRIGCEAADTVAAIGSVAGAVVDMDACDPARPLPVMAFHGTLDPLVPYKGGDMQGALLAWAAGLVEAPTFFVGAENWTATWAEGNGCHPTPEAIPQQGDVHGLRYLDCDQDAEVILYTVEGGGHTWPGGAPIPGVGKTTRDIDATEELWRFFQAHTLED